MKKNLFGLSQSDCEALACRLGEKAFRGKQLYQWIYQNRADSVEACKNLPKSFKQSLEQNGYDIVYPQIVKVQQDPKDGTRKYLLKMQDGENVESVLMRYPFGYSVCLSTQVGCAMGCAFCASGKYGKKRNLSAAEIAGQIAAIERDTGERISNVVLMGMGEPLDNYDEVLKFIHLANTDLGIGQRHITLSTCGLVPKIKKLADEKLQINLAISLHSPFQQEREKIMPVARAYPLPELVAAADEYFEKTGRRVTYEYTLIDGVNDRREDAAELKKLLGGRPNHINLIPLNDVTENTLKSSHNVNLFNAELKKAGLTSTIRKKNGANIDAACGQLRNREQEVDG